MMNVCAHKEANPMALYTDLGKHFPDIYNSQATLNYFINLCG